MPHLLSVLGVFGVLRFELPACLPTSSLPKSFVSGLALLGDLTLCGLTFVN